MQWHVRARAGAAGTLLSTLRALCPALAAGVAAAADAAPQGWAEDGPLLREAGGGGGGPEDAEALVGALAGAQQCTFVGQ